MKCLQKLLPLPDKRMDMATVLEEAYKYVKYLQAQVRVLESMPPLINGGGGGVCEMDGGDDGMWRRLGREEMLGVVVNSKVAQTEMYSKGVCVYSVEQLNFLNRKMMLN